MDAGLVLWVGLLVAYNLVTWKILRTGRSALVDHPPPGAGKNDRLRRIRIVRGVPPTRP